MTNMEYPRLYLITYSWGWEKHVLVKDRMEDLALKAFVDEGGCLSQQRIWLYEVQEVIKEKN